MRFANGWPRGLAAVVVVGVLAPVGLGLAWVVARSVESPLRADAPAEPLVVTVGSAARAAPAQVLLTVEYSQPLTVAAAGSGVVTDVHVAAGEELAAGEPVISVDDQEWMSFVADAPLWRDLSLDMTGDDVARAQDFLAALELPAGTVPGRVTGATAEGFRQFNQLLGRGNDDRVFHRSTVLWVGAGPLAVHEVAVQVGDVVAANEPVLFGPTLPVSVLVEESDPITDPDGPYVLAVREVTVPYTPGSGRVDDPESAETIAELLPNGEGAGRVQLADPVEVATLPVAAIVTDADGRTCVFEDVAGPPVPLEVAGGTLANAEVPTEWVGRQVLANPREVREDLSCGSP